MIIEFGDRVRFVDNETTREAGVATKKGVCLGFTTPSITNIEYIGKSERDYAISIQLDETSQIIWTTQDLVEFLDHGKGQEIKIGNKRATRRADGTWKVDTILSKHKSGWFKKLFKRK